MLSSSTIFIYVYVLYNMYNKCTYLYSSKIIFTSVFVCFLSRTSCNRQTEYFVNKMSRTVSHPTSVTLQFQQQHSDSTIFLHIFAGCAIRAPPTLIKCNTHSRTLTVPVHKRLPGATLVRKSRNITLCLHSCVVVFSCVLLFLLASIASVGFHFLLSISDCSSMSFAYFLLLLL